MRISHWGLPVACVPVLLAAGGCYSYQPYSPYGPGYGGIYSSPSGGSFPQDGYPQGGGGYQQPFQSAPTPFPTEADPGSDSWQQPSGSGTSGYPSDPPNYNSGGSGGLSNSDPVPFPNDPATPSFNNPAPFNSDPEPFRGDPEPFPNDDPAYNRRPPQPPRGNSTFDSDGMVPFGNDGVQNTPSRQSLQNAQQVQQASHQTEVFEPPVQADKVVVTRHLEATTARAETPEPTPFSYDRKGYRWLRGVVDYDAQDDTWNIIYSIDPDASDRFGGSITLVNDPLLAGLEENDRVLIQGRVDENSRDRFGKPQYRVDHLGRIVPQ